MEESSFKLAVICIFVLQEETKRRIARAICSVIPATKGLYLSVVRGNRREIFDSTTTGGWSSIALLFEPRILILVTSTPRYASTSY